MQQTLSGLLSSDASTVYGSAYDDQVVTFLTLGEWLLLGTHWLYLAIAVPAFAVAVRSESFSQFVSRMAVVCFILLSMTDILFLIIDGSLSLSAALTNGAFNFAGCVFLILVLSAIFWTYEVMRSAVPDSLSDATGAGVLAIAGVIVSSVCYFTLAYFYKLVETPFELVAKAPIHGAYYSRMPKSSDQTGAQLRPFSIIPEDAKGGRGAATIFGGIGSVQWESNEPYKIFDLSIEFFSDCPFAGDIRKLPFGRAQITRKGVKSIALTTEKGVTNVNIAENPQNRFSYTTKIPHFFWLMQKEEKEAEMEHQFFGGPDAVLLNRGPDEQLFYVSFGLMKIDSNTKTSQIAPRKLKIVVDGETTILTFKRDVYFDPKGKIDCSRLDFPIEQTTTSVPRSIGVLPSTLFIGARFRITPRADDLVEVFRPNANTLRIAKANGWSHVYGIKPDELAGKLLGNAELMIVEDGLAFLKIDGENVEVKPTDRFVARGMIVGRYDNDLAVHIRGTSDALWFNGERRNPTRWERLPTEVQLFALGLFIAIFGGLWKISRPILDRFHDPRSIYGLR